MTSKTNPASACLAAMIGFVLIFPGKAAANGDSVVIFAPVAGWVTNTVEYPVQNSPDSRELKEDGCLYGAYLMYADPAISIGNLGHYSDLGGSRERSYMFFINYTLFPGSAFRPVAGFAMDYISISSHLEGGDAAPFVSMDVTADIWAFHPTGGIACTAGPAIVTPFAGFFSEKFEMAMNTPGMRNPKMGPPIINGFSADASEAADYLSLGSRLELDFHHFIRIDSKFYYRMREGEAPHFTTRNRLDILVTRQFGLTAKADYFQDRVNTNFFLLAGPAMAF